MNLKQIAIDAPKEALNILKEMNEGKLQNGLEWSEDLHNGSATMKEMIGTADGSAEWIKKTTFDLYQGRENVALLYKDIYTTLTDANFPKTMVAEEFGPVQVVFLEKFEGGEVKFGALGEGSTKTVTFSTYAAGIEYDEDIIEYNQTWKVTEIAVAFGEAYNKLLNHLHLNPILTASYTTTGGGVSGQKTAQEAGTAQLVAFDTDLATTLRNALTVLPRGVKIVLNSSDRFVLEDAIAASMLADTTPSIVKQKLSTANFIEYDGDSVTVGGTEYEYPGVTAGYIFLIVPKQNFKEYIKHDLRTDSNDGDLSRLIVSQVVGRARRAVLAGVGGKLGAIKIDITA